MTEPQTDNSPLSYCGGEARRHDNDRFLAALFAPAAAREGVFALIAFNQEVARTREVVSEPALGLMRLQWWRDAVAACYGEGPLPHHPVAEPLAAASRDFALSRDLFDGLIDAREADLEDEPPPTLAALEAYAESTAAPLQRLMLETLALELARAFPTLVFVVTVKEADLFEREWRHCRRVQPVLERHDEIGRRGEFGRAEALIK